VKSLEQRLREASTGDQMLWLAGVILISLIMIPTFNIIAVIFLAPIWTTTWKALTYLRDEQDPKDQGNPTP
jgi:hypothetical protein